MSARTLLRFALLLAVGLGLAGCGWLLRPAVTLTVSVVGEGTVAKDPDQLEYQYGTTVVLMATPNPGWAFDQWSGDISGTQPTTTITLDGDKAVTAKFTPPAMYLLTIDSTVGGSVTAPGEGVFDYGAGETVALTATADTGYIFHSWTPESAVHDPDNPNTTVSMDADKAVTANFIEADFSLILAVSPSVGGTTVPDKGVPHLFPAGTEQAIRAEPAWGYRFVEWTGDVGTVDDVNAEESTVIMNGNYTITATFEEIPTYELILFAMTGGDTYPEQGDTKTLLEGESITITAYPDPGFAFVRWDMLVGDVDDIDDPYDASTFVTVSGDCVIRAIFTADPVELAIASTAGGSVTPPGEGVFTYTHGDVVELVAVPEVGYEFSAWTGDIDEIHDPLSATTTIEMLNDYVITANFVWLCLLPSVVVDTTVQEGEELAIEWYVENTSTVERTQEVKRTIELYNAVHALKYSASGTDDVTVAANAGKLWHTSTLDTAIGNWKADAGDYFVLTLETACLVFEVTVAVD